MPGDQHRQGQRLEPGPGTLRAGHLAHVTLDLLAHAVAFGFGIASLQVRDDPFVAGGVGTLAPVAVAVGDLDALLGLDPEEENLAGLGRQFLPGQVHGDAVLVGHRLYQSLEELGVARGPRGYGSLGQGSLGVGYHQLGVHLVAGAEAVAVFAGPVGGVEREVAGGQFLEALAVGGPGQVLGEDEDLGVRAGVDELDLSHPFGQSQRRLQRLGQAAVDALAQDQTIHHHLDGVGLVATQLDGRPQLIDLVVDHHPGETLLGEVLEQLLVGALAAPHHRGQHLEPGAFGQLQDVVDDLLGGLADQPFAGLGIVGDADAGVEQAEVVVDLGDGADGGARVARRGFLVDGDGRGKPLDEVHVGLVHLTQELAGVGRKRFDVTALALGVDGVESEGRLARTGQAGERDQLLPRKLEGHIAKVVLARPAHHQLVAH